MTYEEEKSALECGWHRKINFENRQEHVVDNDFAANVYATMAPQLFAYAEQFAAQVSEGIWVTWHDDSVISLVYGETAQAADVTAISIMLDSEELEGEIHQKTDGYEPDGIPLTNQQISEWMMWVSELDGIGQYAAPHQPQAA